MFSQESSTALERPLREGRRGVRSRRPGIRPHERDFLVDAAMLDLATLGQVVTAPAADVPVGGVGWLALYPPLVLVLLALRGMYRPRTSAGFLDDARTALAASAVAAMALTFVRVLVTDNAFAGSQAVREWVFAVAYLTAGRGAIHIVEGHLRRQATAGRRTLIVGAGRVGHLIAQRLREKPEIGLRPVGFVDDDPYPMEEPSGVPVLGPTTEVQAIVEEHRVEHAILSFSHAPHEVDLGISRRLRQLGVSVSVVPRLFEGIPDRMVLDRVGGLPLLSIYPSNPRGWQFSVKYGLDRVLALLTIIVISPLLILGASSVLLTLGRPIFFRQRRVGLDGRPFEMLKFRTMAGDPREQGEADAAWAAETVAGKAVGARAREPDNGAGETALDAGKRTTRLTTFLRDVGIDELPQLFNVMRGDMSIVGPRPERESYVRLFEERIYRYPDRHRVKAGITGWAQVHGLRGETSLADRVEWDNYYIENWSLWLDLKILLLTPIALVRDRGGSAPGAAGR